jgi:hypothetical protein
MTTPAPVYTAPTVAAPALPPVEVWTEIRCPACVPLGWDASKLLFKVYGPMTPSGATVQIRCHRCKSLIEWNYGTPKFRAVEHGQRNHKRLHTAME